MPDIVTLGQKTHYKDECFTAPFEPPPQTILIQHGFGRNSNFWYEWVPLLSGKYRVIRRDARGHGESSGPSRDTYDWGLDTMLAEIVDMLDQLGIEKVHFLGESTSGMLGMAFAAKYPERLHSLIICSSPTYLPPAAMKFFSMGMGSWQEAIRTLGSEGWARALGKLPGTGARKDKQFEDWWAKEVGRSPAYGLEQYSLFLEKLDGREFMKGIHTPTLILAPMHSTAAPVSYHSCFGKWLISGIKNQWRSRSRGPRLYSSMVRVMRFTSTEHRSATKNSTPSSTVSTKSRLIDIDYRNMPLRYDFLTS